MPKNGFLTPKAISNRIKAKGLQKLRWYCQMCEKQCRDANGFKCHVESEAHSRQMALFQENTGRYLDSYSKEFFSGFMDILSRRFAKKRVHANRVYSEFISDRDHTHMNGTVWTSLTSFIQHLGKEGLAKVEETPKGWYLTYIDRDPVAQARAELETKKKKTELDDEQRTLKKISKQVQEAKANSTRVSEAPTELKKKDNEQLSFSLSINNKKTENKPLNPEKKSSTEDPILSKNIFETISEDRDANKNLSGTKRKISAIDEIIENQQKTKERKKRTDYWLAPNIIVKVMNKKLADGKYYRAKGVVEEVIDTCFAKVRILDDGSLIKLNQKQLETVLPAVGGKILIVNGGYRDDFATLKKINVNDFNADVTISSGFFSGTSIKLDYEDICKVAN